MKISTAHVQHIKQAISPIDVPELRAAYKEAGLSDKRYRWDLLYRAKLSQWISDNIYPYAIDAHIDTVLRQLTNTK
jgi:hypothetical protein